MVSRPLLAVLFFIFSQLAAQAQVVIGLSLPLSGRMSPVAERIEFGALAAINKLKADGGDIKLVLVDDGCNERKVPKAVEKLREVGVSIVVGPTCFDIARQLAASLNGEDGTTVPVIALNTRNPLLARYRENEGLPLYEISNTPDAEAKAVIEHILPAFHTRPFAILDDGSVYGRGLADRVRSLGQEAGLRPILSANFRSLQTNQLAVLRRLRRSGVEALFLAASPEDIVTISNDLKNLQYGWTIGTGEAAQLLPFTLNADAVPDDLLMVRPGDLPTENAAQLLQRLKDDRVEVEDALLLGHALIEVAVAAFQDGAPNLENRTFETVVGSLTFDSAGRAVPADFKLYRWKDGAFRTASAP